MPSSENTDPGRIRSGGDRVYGISMSLPDHDPFRLVLGEDWQSYRWYATEQERDAAYIDIQREHRYSRLGDTPTLRVAKVERDKPPAPLARTAV